MFCKKILLSVIILSGMAMISASAAESVFVGKVVSMPRELNRRYIGKISAVNDVSLVPRVSGVIWKQQFANGDFVKKGQELFVIEDTTYIASRNAAKAKLEQCKAEYAFAKLNLERLKSLWSNKATSESSYDEAVRLEAISKAAVAAAEAALLDAENNLSYTRIVSPIDGKTGRAVVSPGNYITPGLGTLVNVVSMDWMYINFWISMNDYLTLFDGSYDTLKKEAVVKIIVANGREFKGKSEVVFIDNRVDKDTDTIRIRIKVKNENMQLIPDGLVTVKISRKDKKYPVVPVSAILNNGKISFVYGFDEKGNARVIPVELGEVQGKNQIVLRGLREGDEIVVDGTHKVFPGRPVVKVPAKNGE